MILELLTYFALPTTFCLQVVDLISNCTLYPFLKSLCKYTFL
jgi:hypothetical protein